MPIYEFYCPDNGKIYSFLARSSADAGKVPRCPDNPKFRMERQVSAFAVTGRAKEPGGDPANMGGPEDARLEAAMAEMERQFAGIGDGEPDPRMLAKMMRKMTGLTGEKMPPEVEEMIGRMEKGEDPEKLEEEFGDAFDKMEMPEGGGGDAGEAAEAAAIRALRRLRPKRDPKLYDLSEYL